jgi:hypothetical protein
MEDAALAGPPAVMEWAVERLLPATARESVIGDLREVYRNPRQYLREALSTVPGVVAGCALRTLNLPVLGLNGVLIWLCLAGLQQNGRGLGHATIFLAVAGGLAVLILAEIYGDCRRPTAKGAVTGALWTVGLVGVLCVWNFGMRYQPSGTPDYLLEFGMLQSLPFVFPVLGLLRMGLVLQSDWLRERQLDRFCDLEDEERAFLASVRRMSIVEAGALVAGAFWVPALAGPGLWFPALFLASAAYLIVESCIPSESDPSASLRARYRQQVWARRQIRQFLIWLWAAPFLIAACRWLLWPGFEEGRAILVAFGASAIVAICFLAHAAGAECTGLLGERLSRLERPAPDAPI